MIFKKIFILTLFLIAIINLYAVKIELDTNNDGKIDRWINCELEKNWKMLDLNKNSKPDESCFYISDTEKIYFINNEEFDESVSGKPNIWIKNEVKGKDFYTEIKIDQNKDGECDAFFYKKNDIIYLYKMDSNGDKIIDTIEEYDTNGFKTKESNDTNNDGKMDDHYFWDKDLLQKEEIDSNFDSKPDIWVFFKYNEDTSMKECIIEKDNNFDGKTDEWHYTDSKRRVIRIEKDINFDGKVDDIKKMD